MRNVGLVTLSPYENSVIRKTQGALSDLIVANKRTQSIVDAFAKAKVSVRLDDGTTVEPTIEELIILKGLMTEVNKSRGFQSILDFQKVRGEQDGDVKNVNVSLVDQDLAKRAVK